MTSGAFLRCVFAMGGGGKKKKFATTLTRAKYTSFIFKYISHSQYSSLLITGSKEISPRVAKFRFGELDRKREKRREKWRRLRSITKNAVADRVPYIFMGTVYGFYSLHINYIVKDSPGAAR